MLLFCPTMHIASGVFLQTLKSNAKKVFLRIANAKNPMRRKCFFAYAAKLPSL